MSKGYRWMKAKKQLPVEELVRFAQFVDYLIANYYCKGSAIALKQRERSGRIFSAVLDLLTAEEEEVMTHT